MMIGNGMPISHKRSPRPKPILASLVEPIRKVQQITFSVVPTGSNAGSDSSLLRAAVRR
jgi:hypothetical protein